MSTPGESIWLRCYPPAWRARYGAELEDLIQETSSGDRVAWRVRRDLVKAGARERLHSWGLGGGDSTPDAQAKAGVVLVLCAWALFVVAGVALQRVSEHWQEFTPASGRALPSGAFQTLVVAALVAGALVLAGGACVLPRLSAFLRGGGWREVRHPVIRAALVSVLAIAATEALVIWAHHLEARQRSGHDFLYGFGFVAGGLLVIACVAAWTAAAIATLRRIELTARLLKLEVGLAAAVGAAILTMTGATATWWATLAIRAPWALHEQRSGAHVSPLMLQLLATMILMVAATALAGLGAVRALRALPHLSSERRAG